MTHVQARISIKRRLVLGIVMISGLGLFLACAGFSVSEYFTFKTNLTRQVEVLADILGYNSSSIITFADAREAERALQSLEAEPHIRMACFYRPDGSLLSAYTRASETRKTCPQPRAAGSLFEGGYLHVFRDIHFNGDFVGKIYLQSDLSALSARISTYLLISAALITSILFLTVALAGRFQTTLTGPLSDLVTAARRIAEGKDYSLRVVKKREDELGALVSEFNSMLEQIELRDREVQSARNELERRVEARTADLQAEVTERKATAERLRKGEEFLRNVLDLTPSMIFVKDVEGRYLLVNQATAEFFRKNAEDILGQTDESIPIRPLREGEFAERHAEVLLTGKDCKLTELGVIDPLGNLRWVYSVKRLLHGPDGAPQVLSVATDITDSHQAAVQLQRAKEAAEAANRSKSEFLANMSHEIRTPMNGIIGMANLLLETQLDPEQREFARTIASSSEALLTILSDILDFSKIEAGKLSFESIPFDLHDAIESTMDLLAPRGHEKGLELSCFIDNCVDTNVQGDPTRLRQVILNLVGNAIKFTSAGEVALTVRRLTSPDPTDQQLRVEVRDSGIGIPPDIQQRLFRPFSQADGSTTRKYGGTGLGLCISRQLVEMMQGQIGILKSDSKGTTFWFTVALKRAGEKLAAERLKFPDCRALVVTASPAQREIIKHYVEHIAISSTEAMDGPEALQALRERALTGNPFSMAILDWQLPGMRGNELVRLIRSEPLLAGTSLILLTSLGTDAADELSKFGSIPCVAKPVKRRSLYDAVSRQLCVSVRIDPVVEPALSKQALTCSSGHTCGRILIAEDNLVNQKLAIRMVKKLGHAVEVVPDGIQVLNAIDKCSFDLVLMDCQMPEMDGYEATQRIRQRKISVNGKHLPIVAMTANAMEGDREKCLAAGMDDYITKPMKIEELDRVISRWLENGAKASRSLLI